MRFENHTGRFGPTDRQPVASNLEFQRVAKRRPAEHPHGRTGGQPHFQEPNRHPVIAGDIAHPDGFAENRVVERVLSNSHGLIYFRVAAKGSENQSQNAFVSLLVVVMGTQQISAFRGGVSQCRVSCSMAPGFFVVGTDTGVGKTAVAAGILRSLVQSGRRVGGYKPVASGIATATDPGGDPVRLWEAAGRPLSPHEVCPQVFAAPLSPPRSSLAEGRRVDDALLRTGLTAWQSMDVVVVEGAGGLFSPLGHATLGVDLARDFGLPLVIVDAARLGGIGRTLCAARAARAEGLLIAACVFSEVAAPAGGPGDPDRSVARQTATDLAALLPEVPVTILWHDAAEFDPPLDWWAVATGFSRLAAAPPLRPAAAP